MWEPHVGHSAVPWWAFVQRQAQDTTHSGLTTGALGSTHCVCGRSSASSLGRNAQPMPLSPCTVLRRSREAEESGR